MMQACTPYSSAGPDCKHTTMCRWVPAVFSGMPNPSAASSMHNVSVAAFLTEKRKINNEMHLSGQNTLPNNKGFILYLICICADCLQTAANKGGSSFYF